MGCRSSKTKTTNDAVRPLSQEEYEQEAKKYEEVTPDYVVIHDAMIDQPIYYYILFARTRRFISIGRYQGIKAGRVFHIEGKGLVNQEVLMFENRYIVLPLENDVPRERIYKLKTY